MVKIRREPLGTAFHGSHVVQHARHDGCQVMRHTRHDECHAMRPRHNECHVMRHTRHDVHGTSRIQAMDLLATMLAL